MYIGNYFEICYRYSGLRGIIEIESSEFFSFIGLFSCFLFSLIVSLIQKVSELRGCVIYNCYSRYLYNAKVAVVS